MVKTGRESIPACQMLRRTCPCSSSSASTTSSILGRFSWAFHTPNQTFDRLLPAHWHLARYQVIHGEAVSIFDVSLNGFLIVTIFVNLPLGRGFVCRALQHLLDVLEAWLARNVFLAVPWLLWDVTLLPILLDPWEEDFSEPSEDASIAEAKYKSEVAVAAVRGSLVEGVQVGFLTLIIMPWWKQRSCDTLLLNAIAMSFYLRGVFYINAALYIK